MEPKLTSSQLVLPFFVSGHRKEDIAIEKFRTGAGVLKQYGYADKYATLLEECRMLVGKGLRNVMLFGVVGEKDSKGTLADDCEQNPVMNAIKAIRRDRSLDKMSVMADVCLCEYTDHGHCGVLEEGSSTHVNNEISVNRLAEIAVSYADVGADVVVPSDMMDGRIGKIRDSLTLSGNGHVAIMSHSSKKASVLYAPFRSAVESTFSSDSNRKHYQHPVGSSSIAMRSVMRDLSEGADIVMVKPSLMYGDLISRFKEASPTTPVAAYVVSGECKMLYDYGESTNSLSEIVRESHLSLVRAGASIIVSYMTPMLLDEIPKWSDLA